ncbi:MAG: hypothetical protein DRR06_05205 [Gammaproteobacteria bacterium]|nr:MAG: hypothetical protein DRR42_18930 [Gammaproteobacteria bacterium]RLA46388.1 MAG: hypothetical protein DRR06_05205 [Gammaproteobacteria bacterium]
MLKTTKHLPSESGAVKSADKHFVEQGLKQLNLQEKGKETQAAKLVADQLLKKLISKADLSSGVLNFLQNIWRPVLCNVYLSKGESSRSWKNIKKVSSVLIWTLSAKSTEKEKRMLLTTLPSLKHALSRGMERIQVDTAQQEAVFQMMEIEHEKIISQSGKDSTVGFDVTTASAEKNTDESQGDINRDDDDLMKLVAQACAVDEESAMAVDHNAKIQNMKIGTRVNFDVSGTIDNIGELYWKSNLTGRTVFVNTQGQNAATMNIRELVSELSAGRAKILES